MEPVQASSEPEIVQTPPQPEVTQSQKYPKSLYVLALLCVALAISIYTAQKNSQIILTAPPSSSPHYEYPSPTPAPEYVLKRKYGSEWEKIASFMQHESLPIIKWNNYLIFENQDDDTSVVLMSHNTETGKTVELFRQDDTRSQLSIGMLTIRDDTLYFGTEGYLAIGATYWMNLPPDGKAVKMMDSANADFAETWGHTWIVGGEGDSCWGQSTHYLFDSTSRSAQRIFDSHYGCNEGDELLGVDAQDRLIIATHRLPVKESESEPEQFTEYTELKYSTLSNPQNTSILLSKDGMPRDISYITYLPTSYSLLLAGDNGMYVYSLTSSSLEPVHHLPDSMKDVRIVRGLSKNTLCLWDQIYSRTEGPIYESASIILGSQPTFSRDSAQCEQVAPDDIKKSGKIELSEKFEDRGKKYIQSLKLPVNYSIELE